MRTSATKAAYDAIQEMIFRRELGRGEKVPEAMLVDRLGISRTPIREALKLLERDGLVTISPQCYSQVADYSKAYIAQIGVARVALETLAVKLALHYGSNAEFLALEQINAAYRRAIDAGDTVEKIALDCRFHQEISNIGKNAILIDMQRQLYLKVRFLQTYSAYDDADRYRSVRRHEAITAALFARDGEEAVRRMKEHLMDFYELDPALPELG